MDSAFQTSTEQLEDNRVRMRVEVPESKLEPALDSVYRRWSREIRVPGFRKGKVPRRVIDTRVGVETVRQEALEEALPGFYSEAVRSEDLQPIAPPEIKIVDFEPGVPLVFEATIDLRPEIELPDLSAVVVDAPDSEVTDDDLREQLDRLRDRFAELETVHREARRGDYAVIDLKGYKHDEPVEGASAPDLLFEIGSHSGPPKLDSELEGARPGEILKFSDSLPEGAGELAGEEISFTVLVKEIQSKKLPALDDEFAKTVGEFDTLDALREDLRTRMGDYKQQLAAEQLSNAVLEAFVNAAELEPPARLVEEEFDHRLHHVTDDLKRAGMTVDQYATQAGSTELEMRADIRRQAATSVKAELLLEEVARRNDIQVGEEDIGREIAYLAARTERDPKEVAQQLSSGGHLSSLMTDIIRRKALDHVVDHVTVRGRPRPPDREEETGEDSADGDEVQVQG